ncbi:MAG: CBS domain-containing protein [Candidatus Moranbacteria bacterium]|nr:CBS domain-containing protein [Candidatus Moranbacteria bacterium]
MATVRDIMTTNIISVKADSSAQAVADLITQHQIHAVPIVNELFELQGIVAEGDFFYGHSGPVSMASYLINKTTKKSKVEGKSLSEITVGEIMTAPCISVLPSLSVEEAGKLCVDKSFNTLPVVDEGKTLVGIVTAHDILKSLLASR